MPPARNAARAASPLRGRTAGNGPRKKVSSTKKSRSADKPLPAGERLGVDTARKEVEVAPAPPVLAMSADRTEEIEAAEMAMLDNLWDSDGADAGDEDGEIAEEVDTDAEEAAEAASLLASVFGRKSTARSSDEDTTRAPVSDAERAERAAEQKKLPSRLLLGLTLGGVEHVLGERSKDGIKYAKSLAKRPTFDGYVNQVLCKQEAEVDGLSTCERLNDRGAPFVGKATVYVSWHFGTLLTTLLDALRRFLLEKSLDPTTTFFWISDFSLRQTSPGADLPRLPEIIGAIKHSVLLLEPWSLQSCKRIWVLWEMYHTFRQEAQFDTLMSTAQASVFKTALCGEEEVLLRAVAPVDVRSAECHRTKDRDLILGALQASIGIDTFDRLMSTLMRAALADEARGVVDRMDAVARAQQTPEVAATIHNAATLLYEAGDSGKAIALYKEALAKCKAMYGDDHPETMRVISRLAAVLQETGDKVGAVALMREEIAVSRELNGEHHPYTLTSINDLAVLLADNGEYADAEVLYVEALAGQRATLGNRHPSTMLSMNNLASLLRAKGDLAGAVKLHAEALALQREENGDAHEGTLSSMYNLGTLLIEFGDAAGGEALLREELHYCRLLNGDDHPDTIASMENLEHVVCTREGVERAKGMSINVGGGGGGPKNDENAVGNTAAAASLAASLAVAAS